jgi:hypothetical protein
LDLNANVAEPAARSLVSLYVFKEVKHDRHWNNVADVYVQSKSHKMGEKIE